MTTTARRAAAVCVLLAVLCLTSGPAALAQAPPQGRKVKTNELKGFGETDIDQLDLEKMIEEQQATLGVASARPVAVEQVPGSVTVFKAEEIRNLGARTLLELLRFVPGFDITFDNLGRARIAVRGIASTTSPGGSQDVLILQDGMRLNQDLTGGATTINLDLPLDHVRQVEILRGPAAAVYGDSALAAVVSVISQTTDDFLGTEGSVGFGSFATQRYALRSGGILGGVKISGFLRFADADGARRLVPADAQTAADASRVAAGLLPISVAPGKARDGVRALDAAYAFATREWTFSFRTKNERAEGHIGAAENLTRLTELNNNQFGVEARWKRPLERGGTVRAHAGFIRNQIGDLLEVYPSGYELRGDFGTLIFGEPGGQGGVFEQLSFNSRRFDLGGSLERDLPGGHKLTGGIALLHESTYDLEANVNLDLRTLTPVEFENGAALAPLPGAVPDWSRTTFGLYAEDQWKAGPRLNVTAGLRFDHLSDLGGTLHPRLALVSTLRDGLTVKALYGRAFRAPTFRELAFDLPGGTGNPDLRMVQADELELAVAWTRNRLRAEAHPFLSVVHDTIVLPGQPVPGTQQTFANAKGLRTAGIELLATGGFGVSHTFFASYTFQNPTDRATGEPVPGLPRGLLNLGVGLDIHGRVTVTPTLVARTGRARGPEDPRGEVSGYALFGVTVRAKNIWRSLEASLSLDNLFGKEYFDPSLRNGVPGDYPRPGTRALVHVAYKF